LNNLLYEVRMDGQVSKSICTNFLASENYVFKDLFQNLLL